MRLLDVIRKAFPARAATSVPASASQIWHPLHEPFAGAWQRGWRPEMNMRSLLAVPSVRACVTKVAADVGMLPFRLRARQADGTWRTVTSAAFSPVLRSPNGYQTPAQFREAWTLSRLLHGNTFVLLERDHRNVVTGMHVLDPSRVQVLVADDGDVFYRLQADRNAGIGDLDVPSDWIAHDREGCFFSPHVGTAPLHAAMLAAQKNLSIEESSSAFFGNAARPSGLITAPAGLSETDAAAMREHWQGSYTGSNSGKVALIGADLKFVPLGTAATDAQLVEQLRLSDEQVCRAFGVPPYLVGIGALPAGLKIDELQQFYLTATLQPRIEAMEDLLDAALRLGEDMGVELDTAPLLRMDQQRQAQTQAELVKAGIASPNEARLVFNLPPASGGESPYLQQQNYSLAALAKRDARLDPFGTNDGGKEAKAALREVRESMRRLEHRTAQEPASDPYALRGRVLTRDMRPRMRWNSQFGAWAAVH